MIAERNNLDIATFGRQPVKGFVRTHRRVSVVHGNSCSPLFARKKNSAAKGPEDSIERCVSLCLNYYRTVAFKAGESVNGTMKPVGKVLIQMGLESFVRDPSLLIHFTMSEFETIVRDRLHRKNMVTGRN